MTNESRCVLSGVCRNATTESCTNSCGAWISMHGLSGNGGRVASALIPREYANVTLDTSPAGEANPKIYAQLLMVAESFGRQFDISASTPPDKRIKSIYLWSREPGNGKTTSACAMANEWLIRHYIGCVQRGIQPMQQPAYFLDVNEWQGLYLEFNRKNIPQDVGEKASREYYKRMRAAMEAPFAVLDDLGVREMSNEFRSDLHRIIQRRVVDQKVTVYTSNLPMESLQDIFREPTPRLYDRIRDMCLQFEFKGTSKRGKRK